MCAVFLDELPGWFLWPGIFLPVTALLLLLIAFFSCELTHTEQQLAVCADPRQTAYLHCFRQQTEKRRHTPHTHKNR
ncbi:small leucine-rich protein 1-like [Danio aesculapii]|uniref:small leucine-rich protein 1-like n=1 Tax=Danio aesculapii TaxID=1142201 RepID=UPI0024C083A3|nr:small leucine-rich protein 1-like [Danio aesculapii]